MAMCDIAVVGDAPCQCFSPGANQTTSPGRISSTGPPSRCAQPQPDVTTSVWPSGCVCHAVRAPGSNVTDAPCTNAGSGAWKSGSIRTERVNQSDGPLAEGCEPLRLISIFFLAIDHALQGFRVAGTMHCYGGKGVVNLAQVGRRKLDVRSAEIFLEA